MLDIRNLKMEYGLKLLFQHVDLNLVAPNHYGVVGANGMGKSTFLKILVGDEEACGGSVDKPKNITIGILGQDQFKYENDKVIDVVIQGNANLWQALKEKLYLLEKENHTDEDGYRLAALEEIIIQQNGYIAQGLAAHLLTGLGIEKKYYDGPLHALSGGYKLRVLLAKLLFQKPDIMLLDEPTNHLDIVSIAWLEEFLQEEFKGLLIFISHDRSFLNNLSTHILDIDYGTMTEYVGNYNKFVLNKELILQQKQHELEYKEKQIESMQQFVDKFGAKATKAKQAQSRLKMIERIESDLPDIKDSSFMKPYFHFSPPHAGGKTVLKVEGISKQFDERKLLNNISFILHRGEKCAVIGPNGIGKSTLLKVLLNEIPANEGRYEWNQSIHIGYFAQDYHSQLSANITIWDWLEDQVSATHQEIRNVLGQVLFRGDDVKKKLAMLSGGESARLVLASLILKKCNMLVLDEPTNHLDLEATDALIEAMQKFLGAILFVSHNRYFIDSIATRVLALTEHHGVQNYLGNYHDYLAQYGKDYLSSG